MSHIQLLVPTFSSPGADEQALAPRRREASNLALLHNGQPIFDRFAPLLLDALRPLAKVTSYRKSRYSSPAEEEMLRSIREGQEAAIVGLAC